MNKFGKSQCIFGLWGTIMLFTGLSFTIYLGIDKLYFDTDARLISSRPEFLLLSPMILGSQFFIVGFIAEIFLSNNRNKNQYTIKKNSKNDN